MPFDISKYPPNWRELARRLREERAGGRCECRGECDDHHAGGRCGAPQRARIRRARASPSRWRLAGDVRPSAARHYAAPLRVVLTVAHLCHDPACDNEECLRALCQRCHLRVDRYEHAAKAAATRKKNEDLKRGQLALPFPERRVLCPKRIRTG